MAGDENRLDVQMQDAVDGAARDVRAVAAALASFADSQSFRTLTDAEMESVLGLLARALRDAADRLDAAAAGA